MSKELNKAAVSRLLVRGWRQCDIARKLKLAPSTVSQYRKEIQQEFSDEASDSVRLDRDREIAKLDEIEKEAWAEWERSKMEGVKTKVADVAGKRTTERLTAEQGANTVYLTTILKCNERRCKILGIEAPDALKIEAKIETVAQEVVVASREEVKRMVTFTESQN